VRVSSMDLPHVVWRKSRRSHNGGANCVEIADTGQMVAVRDSKAPAGGRLALTPNEWATFTNRIKRGDFNLT
jgi:Domain of unknown function (DUF397)